MISTITAQFADRRSADLAIEHLVQEYGIDRTDVFVSPASQENSAGSQAAGADAESGHPNVDVDAAPALEGDIEVSVDLNTDNLHEVRAALIESGGKLIERKGRCRDRRGKHVSYLTAHYRVFLQPA